MWLYKNLKLERKLNDHFDKLFLYFGYEFRMHSVLRVKYFRVKSDLKHFSYVDTKHFCTD